MKLRHDPVALTAAAGWGGRIVAAASQFAVIPLLTDMLGVDGYGAFAVLTSLLTWFALADLGFGSSLQNFISGVRVHGGNVSTAMWSTTRLLIVAGGVLAVLALLASRWAGTALLGSFNTIERSDAILGFAVFSLIAIGTGVSSVALKIAFAEHRGYVAHLSYVVSGLIGLSGLFILKRVAVAHPFTWALAIYTSPGFVVPALIWLHQLHKNRPAGNPADRGSYDPVLVQSLWKSARVFLLFNSLSVLVLNVDYVILSQTAAGEQVAVYAVYAKCYALVFFVFNSIVQAYWPVSAEMLHRREITGLASVIRRCLLLGAAIVLASTAGLSLFRPLIQHLLLRNAAVDLPLALLPWFAAYWLIRVWTDTFAMVILSGDKGIVLCLVVPVQVLLNFVLSYYGARQFGIAGLLAGTLLSFLLTVAWVLPAYVRLHTNRLARNSP